MIGSVYYWKNKISGKIYIGSSLDTIQRFNTHLLNSSNKSLRSDIEQQGICAFSFGILEFIELPFASPKSEIRELLMGREQFYVDLYLKIGDKLSDISYNVNASVYGIDRQISEETRKRMSASGKLKIITPEHAKHISENHASKKVGYRNWAAGKKMNANARAALDKHINGVKKPVLKYDMDGNYIDCYKSLVAAGEKNDLFPANISKCVAGISKTCGGFIWRKHVPGFDLKIKVEKPPKVIAYDLNMNRVGVYEHSFDVEKKMGINHSQVLNSLTTGRPTVGYYFEHERI